jgi:FAD:protein FMN transferase
LNLQIIIFLIMRKSFFLLLIISLLVLSCKPKTNPGYVFLEGFTQGTTYHITYEDQSSMNYIEEIELIFREIDSSMSVYRQNSIISGINNNDDNFKPDHYFIDVVSKAIEISNKTNGAFDITVGPLVNAWGFGFSGKMNISRELIDSLKGFVGIEKIHLNGADFIKSDPRIRIDVNAIAKGYTVDVVSEFLENKGVENYMVEIGGELRVKGINPKGTLWRIGVDKPIDDPDASERELQAVLAVQNIAMATSGNYRKFYIENGMKYSHTIDPQTGFPVTHNLLGATVFANNCMEADAYATAFMVMGLEKTKEFVRDNSGIEVYLIYDKGGELGVFFTEKLGEFIEK